MPDARITELAALTGVGVASGDPLVIVDVSDTSMAPTGTDKKISAGELALAFQALLDGSSTRSIAQTAHGLTVGNVVRFDATDYVKAQADSADNAEVVGIVAAATDADNFTLASGGHFTGLSGLTAGSVYFLDAVTAGALTATEPSAIGEVSKPLLLADSTTSGYLFNFRGEVITPDGGATTDQFAFYSGNDVSVPNNSSTFTFLTWDSLDAGIALLDLTDPEHPLIITAGIYSVTAAIYDSTEITPGGGLQAVLHLDHHGMDAICEMTYGAGSRADGRYLVSLNNTFYIPAGGEIAVTITNSDGAVAHDVKLREVIIQRVQ